MPIRLFLSPVLRPAQSTLIRSAKTTTKTVVAYLVAVGKVAKPTLGDPHAHTSIPGLFLASEPTGVIDPGSCRIFEAGEQIVSRVGKWR